MPETRRIQVGGSFAPPLSDEKLADYKARIEALEPSAVKDGLTALLTCCERWWDLPEPEGTDRSPHPVGGRATIVTLQDDHAKALDEHIPWTHELDALSQLFDTIPADTDKPTRDMAFHLLWHVKELDLGREPLTSDKL